jgi:hypothetical protein
MEKTLQLLCGCHAEMYVLATFLLEVSISLGFQEGII